jgi:hypothetical protein
MPANCLQNEKFPAHILWNQKDQYEIKITIPKELEVVEIFNVPNDGVQTYKENSLKITKFEFNGYFEIVFRSKTLESPRKQLHVKFILRDISTSKEKEYNKTIDLFRPAIKLGDIPSIIEVKIDDNTQSIEVKNKIPVNNIGDGTALVVVNSLQDSDFELTMPEGLKDFMKKVMEDLSEELKNLKKEFPENKSVIEQFLDLFKKPITLDKKRKEEIQLIFSELESKFIESESFFLKFGAAFSYSYLKNIQLITEVSSFMDYLNSIGTGRIILINSLDTIKSKKESGILNLIIQTADIGYNDYPSLQVPPIKIKCNQNCRIPIHCLFDWKGNPIKKLRRGKSAD